MTHFARQQLLVLGLIALLALTVSAAQAQTGSGYDLTWSTIDGGGGASAGGGYTVAGTIGQFDAGDQSGGIYTLTCGFWQSVSANQHVFLPLVLK